MVRRKYDIAIIIGIVLVLLLLASFRSEFRLQAEIPKEFFDSTRVPREKRSSEQKIARAYWDCAVKEVQWKYGYAHRLPDDPPAEFLLSPADVGPIAKDETVRRFYWQKLRATWNLSSAWKNQWELSFSTFRQSLRTGGDWWKELVRSIVRQ
jgi:hypothetical protein